MSITLKGHSTLKMQGHEVCLQCELLMVVRRCDGFYEEIAELDVVARNPQAPRPDSWRIWEAFQRAVVRAYIDGVSDAARSAALEKAARDLWP
jgi:hypothetical protein